MKLIMQFPPTSFYFLPLMPKYSPQHSSQKASICKLLVW